MRRESDRVGMQGGRGLMSHRGMHRGQSMRGLEVSGSERGSEGGDNMDVSCVFYNSCIFAVEMYYHSMLYCKCVFLYRVIFGEWLVEECGVARA